ncbi:MAG: hypothetical protein ACKVOP_06025 [Sphingomonadaceae bacterium]
MTVRILVTAAFAAAFLLTSPIQAQQRMAADDGNYWEVSRIDVLPGQGPAYIEYLAKEWKKQQEYAKSKGWIVNYRVLSSTHARDGEPDLILITEFKDWPSNEETKRRDEEYFAWAKSDPYMMAKGAGERGVMRKSMGQTLYQEMILKP